MKKLTNGILVKEAVLEQVVNKTPSLIPLAGAALGAGALGTGIGYGAAKLTAPSIASVQNLRKEEEYHAYKKAIDEVKTRLAARKQQVQGI